MRALPLTLAAALGLAACAPGGGARPMAQMQGDCAAYQVDIARERALAQTQGAALTASASMQEAFAPLPIDQKVIVKLLPQSQVTFRRPPERRQEQAGDRHGGMLVLQVPADGSYRIGTGVAAWVDVLTSAGKAVQPATFEMQTGCADLFKTVVFALRADEVYTLQLSASRAPALAVYVVPHSQ